VCNLPSACVLRQTLGCHLTTLFGTVAESAETQAIPAAVPKKHGWLPLLTVLFLVSYGLMTMLIVEQGQTIESQRSLIRELFRDSTELAGVKMKTQQEARAQAQTAAAPHNPSSQKPSTQTPSTQTPSTQTPSTQAPSTQAQAKAPSSQAVPQQHAQIQIKPKSQVQTPSRPASDLQDARRSLITI